MAFANISYFRLHQYVWAVAALFLLHSTHNYIFFSQIEYYAFKRKYYMLNIYFISAPKKYNFMLQNYEKVPI